MELNLDLHSIVTPIKVETLASWLRSTHYPIEDREELINGFKYGFDLGYRGSMRRNCLSGNLPFNVGNEVVLWNKIMKEIKSKRMAGPYDSPPFRHFVQSPVGLVPKANGTDTRMIFHLSYDFGPGPFDKSINHYTPVELCTVHYKDLDHAVDTCLNLIQQCPIVKQTGIFFSKTDQASAFRVLPLQRKYWKVLLIKANNPLTGTVQYFVNKAVPFGSSRSCALYQKFSDALRHLIEYITGKTFRVTNYLDDFLFIAESERACHLMVSRFINLCAELNCPLSEEKTVWPSQYIVFLGILLDGVNFVLAIPREKRTKAINSLLTVVHKRKATVLELQRLTGLLNFLTKAIVPGRTFTRRMYAKYAKPVGKNNVALKKYHHIKLDAEFKADCRVWLKFLQTDEPMTYYRPFIDRNRFEYATVIQFFTDAALTVGFGCFYDGRWIQQNWDKQFMQVCKPSINYLELYALCVGIMAWAPLLANKRLIVFCDNTGVRDMVNAGATGCKHSMILIRKLVFTSLLHNFRVFVRYVESSKNDLADALSREHWATFWRLAPKHTRRSPDAIPTELWPLIKIWNEY